MSEGEKKHLWYKNEDQIDLFFALTEKVKKKIPNKDEVDIDFKGVKSFEYLLDNFKNVSHHGIITKEINKAVNEFNNKQTEEENKLKLIDPLLFWRFLNSVRYGIEFRWSKSDHKAIKYFLGDHEIFDRVQTEATLFKQSYKAELFVGKKFWIYIEETDKDRAIVGISKARIEFKSLIKVELTKIDLEENAKKEDKKVTYEGKFKFSGSEKYMLVEVGNNNHQFIFEICDSGTIESLYGEYTNLTKSFNPVRIVLSKMLGKGFHPKFYNKDSINKNVPDYVLNYFELLLPETYSKQKMKNILCGGLNPISHSAPYSMDKIKRAESTCVEDTISLSACNSVKNEDPSTVEYAPIRNFFPEEQKQDENGNKSGLVRFFEVIDFIFYCIVFFVKEVYHRLIGRRIIDIMYRYSSKRHPCARRSNEY